MKVYRLYIEDKDDKQSNSLIAHLARNYFPDGLTIQKAEGLWKGKWENTLIVIAAVEPTQWEYYNKALPLPVIGAANFAIGFLSQEAVGIEYDGRLEFIHSTVQS